MNTVAPNPSSSGTCDNWGLLRSFYFIASEQGITRAAKAQGLAQPSVSAALQRLEKAAETRAKRLTLGLPDTAANWVLTLMIGVLILALGLIGLLLSGRSARPSA